MNELGLSLNNVIQNTMTRANTVNGGQNVTNYVDVDTSFERHRWCEEGVVEPDKNHKGTYLFLSGWPNVTESDTTLSSSTMESDDLAALQANGQLPLPDTNT
ncbi:uncharacterized protein BDV17DRAFT_289629 [Aspergillus undulatus]|uniref:uncharacterized protein n=1 Tax=Aspergillus undulatus TaxID=1810928 RepID=UPI003CCD19F2